MGERGRRSEEDREQPAVLLARRARTIRMCSLDVRRKPGLVTPDEI